MSRRNPSNPIEKIEEMRNLLAFLLVGAFILAIGALLFKKVPEGNGDVITYMIGQLSGMALTALGFYFVNKVGQDALDAKRAENTGKLADAVHSAVNKTDGAPADAAAAADEMLDAAKEKNAEIKGDAPITDSPPKPD